MHCDMAGSAVALATLVALTAIEYPHPVDCWLAITENRLSNDAYKSRDVVTASNGRTIEIIHTDAEGRMALADTLALAGRDKPAAMIDFRHPDRKLRRRADRPLQRRLLQSREHLNADGDRRRPGIRRTRLAVSDGQGFRRRPQEQRRRHAAVRGIRRRRSHAGRTVSETFRAEASANWVHLDLSAATRAGGLAQVPTEITGFGVRHALALILGSSGRPGADHGAARR